MLLQMSLGGSLLILAGGLLRLGFGKKIPAGAFFSLWRLAILRLLLPLSIPIPWGSVQRAEPPGVLHIPSTAPGDAGVVFPAEPVLDTAVSPGRADIPVLGIFWAIGAAAIFLFWIARHLRWRKIYRTALPCPGVPFPVSRRNGRVLQSDRIPAPLTYGVLRPVILLPDRLDPSALPYVLAHEGAHVRRLDTLFQWLLGAAVCLHWMNPLVWLLAFLFNRDMELSCDEAAIRRLGPDARGDYARALLAAEEMRVLPFSAGFSHPTKERIERIMKTGTKTLTRTLLAAAVIAAGVIILIVTSVNPEPRVSNGGLVTAEGEDSSAAESSGAETENWWETSEATEQGLADARAMAEFALKVYGISDGQSPFDNPEFKRAADENTLDDEILTALRENEATSEEDGNNPYTHLMLTVASGEIMPGLREAGAGTDSASQAAKAIYDAFVDSLNPASAPAQPSVESESETAQPSAADIEDTRALAEFTAALLELPEFQSMEEATFDEAVRNGEFWYYVEGQLAVSDDSFYDRVLPLVESQEILPGLRELQNEGGTVGEAAAYLAESLAACYQAEAQYEEETARWWETEPASETGLLYAGYLCEYVEELYGLSPGQSPAESEALQSAAAEGALYGEVMAALEESRADGDDRYERLALVAASGDIVPGLRELEGDSAPLAEILYKAFADAMAAAAQE